MMVQSLCPPSLQDLGMLPAAQPFEAAHTCKRSLGCLISTEISDTDTGFKFNVLTTSQPQWHKLHIHVYHDGSFRVIALFVCTIKRCETSTFVDLEAPHCVAWMAKNVDPQRSTCLGFPKAGIKAYTTTLAETFQSTELQL